MNIFISDRFIAFSIISLFILGLHNLAVYIMRRKDRAPLYFSIYCLLLSCNTATSSIYTAALHPWLTPTFLRKLDVMTIILAIQTFILFLHSFFPEEKKTLSHRFFQISTITFSTGALLITGSQLESLFRIYFLIILIAILYSTIVGIRAIRKRLKNSRGILFGIAVLSTAGINDILWSFHLSPFVLAPLAAVIFAFIYSFLLAKRFATAFAESEQLASELLENQRLRAEMERKTRQEQHLRQIQHRLTALLHTIEAPLCAVNDINEVEFCNKSFEILCGFTLVEMAGKPLEKYFQVSEGEKNISSIPLDLDDGDLTVLLFKTPDMQNTENISVVGFIEQLNRNRSRIQTFENLLVDTDPAMVKSGSQLHHELELIDNALEQMEQLLSKRQDPDKKKNLAIEILNLSLQYWIEHTGKTKADLAKESSIWSVQVNADGWERTQTLDRYLSAKTFPKNPRWTAIIKTADFVLIHCSSLNNTRSQLEKKSQELLLLN